MKMNRVSSPNQDHEPWFVRAKCKTTGQKTTFQEKSKAKSKWTFCFSNPSDFCTRVYINCTTQQSSPSSGPEQETPKRSRAFLSLFSSLWRDELALRTSVRATKIRSVARGFVQLLILLWTTILQFLRMRRSSTRKSGQTTSSPAVVSSTADLFRSATSKAISKELERIDQLFCTYANGSSSLIGPEGIETLCSDIEVDYTDVRILMLAWKMQAEKQGYFTLEEWRRGLKALRVDTISKLKKALPELEKEVRRPSNFVDFYSYAFRYCLTEEKQKSIDIESICELLDLVLGSQHRSQIDSLVQYLKIQNDYKVINMDQWMGFYRFCNEISFPDLKNYDPELAWPLILDNFVEWIKEKKS